MHLTTWENLLWSKTNKAERGAEERSLYVITSIGACENDSNSKNNDVTNCNLQFYERISNVQECKGVNKL